MPGLVKTEAVVLRSMRYGEADRILHVYTPHLGRVSAIAKGVRRARSRFGQHGRKTERHEVMDEFHAVTRTDRAGISDIFSVTLQQRLAALEQCPVAAGLFGRSASRNCP